MTEKKSGIKPILRDGKINDKERKPAYDNTSSGDGPRDAGPRRYDMGSKPYGEKRNEAERKPFGDKRPDFERKSFGEKRPDSERKPFGDKRPDSGGKPAWDRKPSGRGPSLTQELIDLEYEIANLIAQRTTLLARTAKARTDKGLPLADANQERSLRRTWDVVAGREGLEIAPLRGIFILANGLAYSQATKSEVGRKAFYFSPSVKDVDLAIAGPRSLIRTRLLAAVAASAGATCTLTPLVLNDPLVELVKSLNQAGAGLSWEGGTVRNEGGSLTFADKTVFSGGDVLNMYLLLAFALPQVGRMTFTGGAALKIHNLGPAAGVFTGLGARLTAIEPYAPGLPARLESGGMTHNTFTVPDDFSVEAVLALAVAGPTYPEGLRLTWGSGWKGGAMMRHAQAVLASCGVSSELDDNSFAVDKAEYAVPAAPHGADLPLDPLLSASLLALPRFAGGRVALHGVWPAGDPVSDATATLLRAAGLNLEIHDNVVASRPGRWPDKADFDATFPDLLPLAMALGLTAPGDVRIVVDDDADTATAETMAERVGRFARVKPGRVVLVSGRNASEWVEPEKRYSSPSAQWVLALSLASILTPNIGLANPGVLSEVWPGYLSLFSDNFKPKEKEPEKDDPKKKGRRVRIS